MKPALLVIDVQKRFQGFSPAVADCMAEALPNINEAIEAFREKGLPVVWVYDMNEEEGMKPGEPDFEFIEGLTPQPGDLKVNKNYGNAFNKTDLADQLRARGVDTVMVTGFRSEFCVLSSYRGAEDKDFKAILVLECLASPEPDMTRFVERTSESITLGALRACLN